MNLVERYLHAVGRRLPAKNRADILAELRSHLNDTLEERFGGQASEEDVAELLKETGEPTKVAASYTGGRQYLIGPELYPVFRMVALIVLAATIGGQLVAIAVGLLAGEAHAAGWNAWAGLVNSIPAALGSVVIVFLILQHFGVNPDLKEKEAWDPRSLPAFEEDEKVKPSEQIVGIVFGSIFLGLLAAFPGKIGFITFPGGAFYPDPVIAQYMGWIILALLAGIGLNVYLLWQGRWTTGSRVAQVAVNLLSIGVLVLLYQGHTTWLTAHGSSGLFPSLVKFGEDIAGNIQVLGMESFRLAFGIALVVTVVDTVVELVKLVRKSLRKESVPGN